MARLIKCPRCQSQIDATSVAGGSTVRCGDCGAMVRVPTGSTGVYPKSQQPVAAAAPAAASGGTRKRESTKVRAVGGGRQTDLFRKMSGARTPGGTKAPSRASVAAEERSAGYAPRRRSGGNQTMIGLLCGLGVLVLIGALAFGMMAKKDSDQRTKETMNEERKRKNEEVRKQNAINRQIEADEQAAIDAAAAAAKAGAKKPASLEKKDGAYVAPATFEPGARKHARLDDYPLDAGLNKEFESMMGGSRGSEATRDPGKWMPYVVMGLLSDDEKVARGSFQALNDLCVQFKITTESGKNPVRLDLVNSSYARGNDFNFWREWWDKPQNRAAFGVKAAMEELKTMGGGGENPDKANWPDIMKDLRAGGAFDAIERPEGKAFARVKGMGPKAFPHIIKFIDNEDLPLGKAAVTVLNVLSGRSSPMPNEGNKGQLKSEWEAWYSKEHGGK
jgi:hypothetical protein